MLQHLKKMHECLKSQMEKVTPEEAQMIREGHAQAEQSYISAPRTPGKIGGSPEAEAKLEEVFRQRQTGRDLGVIPGPTGQYGATEGAVKGRPVGTGVSDEKKVPVTPEQEDDYKEQIYQGMLFHDQRRAEDLESRIRPSVIQPSIKAPVSVPKLERAVSPNKDVVMQEGSEPVSGNPEKAPLTPAPTKRMHEIVEKARLQKMMAPASTSMEQAEMQAGAMGYK